MTKRIVIEQMKKLDQQFWDGLINQADYQAAIAFWRTVLVRCC